MARFVLFCYSIPLSLISHFIFTFKFERNLDLKALPSYMEFSTYPPTPLKQIFTAASEDSLDLLSKLMYYNPASRLSAADVKNFKIFI